MYYYSYATKRDTDCRNEGEYIMDYINKMLDKVDSKEISRYLAFLKCLQEFAIEREQPLANQREEPQESFSLQ